MNDIDLGSMSGGSIPHVEVFGVPGPCELHQDMLGCIVFVIAPITAALTKPVAPIHLSIVALCFD